MSHFGVLTYKGTGHLNPMITLSRELISRGHRVTFFLSPELEQKVRAHGIEFSAIRSRGEIVPTTKRSKLPSRLTAIHDGVNRIAGDMEAFLRELPSVIKNAGVDTLLVSEIALSGPTLAELLRLPYFIISTSIPHNFGWNAPRSIAHPGSWIDRLAKYVLEVSVLRMRGPVRHRLDRYRTEVGLGPVCKIHKSFPELAHITQLPRCLDIPRSELPENFFYTGPFVNEHARTTAEFPWDLLDGRPLIYASLGTTLKNDPAIFYRISEACSELSLQLVISLGGRRDPAAFADLPGNPIVVRNAPQLELMKRVDMVITHAGPNTVMEALMYGKPMVALPMMLDQPAVATRLVRLGAAEVLSVRNRSTEQIRTALYKVHSNPHYRESALRLQKEINSVCGLERAADVIEETLEKHAARAWNQATLR